MKLGILTVHHSYNYGAILQAFATQKAVESLGHEVECIDFDNTSFINRRKIFLPFNCISNVLRNLRNLGSFRQQKSRKKAFEKFYQMMNISKAHWIDSIDYAKLKYDVILVGSDQTFSLYLTNNPDEMRSFFLPGYKGKKISYASSMGEKNQNLNERDIMWMKQCWQQFSSIGVREKFAKDFIEREMGKSVSIVLDPTLLLSSKDWSVYLSDLKLPKEKYIVFYTVLSSAKVIDFVKKIEKLTNLKVIALHPKTRFDINSGFEYKIDSGPQEFLSFIHGAEYVITTSFHATIFSIIFKKKFISILQGEGNRLKSLLESLDMRDRLVDENVTPSLSLLEKKIDYCQIQNRLDSLRRSSIEYLKSAIDE